MILGSRTLLERKWGRLDHTLITASYFGFWPVTAPQITKGDIELTRHCGAHPHYDAVDKVAVIRTYLAEDPISLPNPLAIAYRKTAFKKRNSGYALHFIGSPSGLAEATLIRTTLSILSERGYKNLRVALNCVGDRESINAYERELIGYARKFGTDLSDEARQDIKADIFNLFRLETPEGLRLRETAPSAIAFLSAPSRLYFKEVLEYIDALGIEFRLAPELVGEKNHVSHTIFNIKDIDTENKEPDTLAIGYRYSRLARLFGLRKEIPMAGVTIFTAVNKKEVQKAIYKEWPKPRFYLVQLGKEAKIQALSLLETLRSQRIPVYHFLGRDQVTAQLSEAERLRVSHLIIIGQKEALDHTVTVRDMATRAQDTVKIAELPRFLKNILP